MITYIALIKHSPIKLTEVITDLSGIEEEYHAKVIEISQDVHLITLDIVDDGLVDVAFQLHNYIMLSESLKLLGSYVNRHGVPIEFI